MVYNNMNKPILITGCARSGTSMTSGIINLCGGWGGKLSGPTRNNKRGMFENVEIRNTVVKPFLISIKCDPLGQKPLPNMKHLNDIVGYSYQLRQMVLSVIKGQGYRDGSIWFYKGAKMSLMWQAWHIAFPDARWILVRRRDEDIVYSCLRTGFMRAYRSEKGWQSWVDHHKENFGKMKKAGLNVTEIWPQEMIAGDFTKIKRAVKKMGLAWKEKEVMEFISPALWSERRKHGRQSNHIRGQGNN